MSQLGSIAEHLEKLQGQANFRLKDGYLKESLLRLAGKENGKEKECADLEVSVECRENDAEPKVALRINMGGSVRCCEFAASKLRDDALKEISDCLVHLAHKQEDASGDSAGEGEEGHETFGMVAAANRLRVSTAWLKSVVPCTYYTYEEVEGRKKIKEYFWSRELIRLLLQLRSKKASPEEIEYIADHCCEGDVAWSREIIGKLKSYSRNESPPRPQQGGKAQEQGKAQPRPAGADANRFRRPRPG